MKPTKNHFLAAFGAILVIALLGAPSAFAESTALCDVDPGTGPAEACPAGHLINTIHETNLSGSKEKMTLGSFVVECDVLFQGQPSAELSNPQFVQGTYTYSNCSNGCTVTQLNKPVFRVLKEGHEKGSIFVGIEVRIVCGLMTCEYFGGVDGKRWGPLLALEANGEVSFIKKELSLINAGLCAASAFLELRTTPLVKTYVTK